MPLYENSLKPIFTKDEKFWSNAFNVSCTRTIFDSILTIQQSVQRSWSFFCTNICIYHVNLNKLLNFNSISPEVRTPRDMPRTQILPGFSTQGRAAHISESATFCEKDRITRSYSRKLLVKTERISYIIKLESFSFYLRHFNLKGLHGSDFRKYS